jgi:glutamyl-tRNA reductase
MSLFNQQAAQYLFEVQKHLNEAIYIYTCNRNERAGVMNPKTAEKLRKLKDIIVKEQNKAAKLK